MKTVGSFTWDQETGELEGPAAYMASDSFAAVKAKIMAGEDPCGAFQFSPDAETAFVVTVQTDYAGWHGMEMFKVQHAEVTS